jgi:hypothetical protein
MSHLKFIFYHIIGHSLERFKPSNVHVNQKAKIGPKLLCLLYSFKKLYSCLHKYLFTFLFFMCNYYVTSVFYHGFHITINYDQNEPTLISAPTWMDGALIKFSFLSLCHFRLAFFLCPFLILISPNLSFFCNFIFSAPPSQFFFP